MPMEEDTTERSQSEDIVISKEKEIKDQEYSEAPSPMDTVSVEDPTGYKRSILFGRSRIINWIPLHASIHYKKKTELRETI